MADLPDAAAVADTFGLGTPAGPLRFRARGDLGRVYRLDAGARWAVKELTGPPDHGDPEGDMELQEAAHAAGIPMPRPQRTVDGRVVATVPTAAGRMASVRVYEWLDLDDGAAVDPATAGTLLARIHALDVAAGGPVHPWYRTTVGGEAWDELVADGEAAGAPWSGALRASLPELVALEELIVEHPPEAVQRCHLDINLENVLVRTDGSPVVIDWENAGAGDPRQELAAALFDIAADDDGLRAMRAGYVAAGGDDTRPEPTWFALTAAVQGHLAELHARHWLGAAGAERRRAAWRLLELHRGLVTRARIDAAVAACRA